MNADNPDTYQPSDKEMENFLLDREKISIIEDILNEKKSDARRLGGKSLGFRKICKKKRYTGNIRGGKK